MMVSKNPGEIEKKQMMVSNNLRNWKETNDGIK